MRRSIDFTKKGEKTSSINPDTLHPNTRSERRQATCGSIGMYCSFDILPQFHECELPSMISNMAHGVRSTSRKCNYRDKHIWIWRSSIRKPFELIKYESFEFTSPISKWLIFDQKLGRRTAEAVISLEHMNSLCGHFTYVRMASPRFQTFRSRPSCRWIFFSHFPCRFCHTHHNHTCKSRIREMGFVHVA